MRAGRNAHLALAATAALALAACGSFVRPPEPAPATPDPDAVRARIVALLPERVARRSDWAADLYAALEALRIEPTDGHLCAILAVREQESGFQVNPVVPGLPAIARREIDARAARLGIPRFAVAAALELRSPDGRTYRERLEGAKTEKALSDLYEDFIDTVPLGRRLFADLNPVHTAGPMQVGIAYAERHAAARPYPFPSTGSIRDEVFTRRGGLYFGIAHLLDYPTRYDDPIYRFADFNAGHYASRNAAFQSALSIAAGTPLELDGDLLIRGGAAREASRTELAVRSLGGRLRLGEAQIRDDLERGDGPAFEDTRSYRGVFQLAERARGTALPRAVIPRIRLESPKITRQLTTEWFARRVDERYERCIVRAAALSRPGVR